MAVVEVVIYDHFVLFLLHTSSLVHFSLLVAKFSTKKFRNKFHSSTHDASKLKSINLSVFSNK